ncbi:hypothetical protein H0H93_009443 [Arthromyces matolae]|nr:hypothetical protein H0H93_009443 [Arthromyces matolae]
MFTFRGIYSFKTSNGNSDGVLTRTKDAVVIAPDTGSENQQWEVNVTPGYHITISPPGSKCRFLGYNRASLGASPKEGTAVVVESFDKFPATAWAFHEVVGLVQDGRLEFSLIEKKLNREL